jgi:NAD(P)H-hydrate epimerase
LTRLVARFYRESDRPMVVDADGLNALADEQDSLAHPGGPRILTPHPGEIARLLRLTDLPSSADDKARIALAADLAGCDSGDQTVVILKGHRTVVCDGQRFAFNETGNPGMATGGTGDCLTGIITGLLCQGMSTWDAARLAAHVHGLAGDIAAECVGQVSLIASDLIDFLPTAFQSLPFHDDDHAPQ